MADYLTNTTELTSVADAIRTKGGTSDTLVFPTGFVSAIENLPSGGGASLTTVTFGEMAYPSAGILFTYVNSSGQCVYSTNCPFSDNQSVELPSGSIMVALSDGALQWNSGYITGLTEITRGSEQMARNAYVYWIVLQVD